MRIYLNNKKYFDIKDSFDPGKTFESGQCFRWNKTDGGYCGIYRGYPLHVLIEDDKISFDCTEEEFINIWYDYFSFDINYDKEVNSLKLDTFALESYEYSKGIRILRQDKWEMLISYIISQQNNIPRIKGIIEHMSEDMGNKIIKNNIIYYTFPTPEALLNNDLSVYKLGYREKYIKEATRKIVEGTFKLDELDDMNNKDALFQLKTFNGIGDKVGNCILLYGYNRLDSFPIDVWMKKIIDEKYAGSIDISIYKNYAGLIQQYMFYYMRSTSKK